MTYTDLLTETRVRPSGFICHPVPGVGSRLLLPQVPIVGLVAIGCLSNIRRPTGFYSTSGSLHLGVHLRKE